MLGIPYGSRATVSVVHIRELEFRTQSFQLSIFVGGSMQNAWNVQWKENEHLLRKVFDGDSPKLSGAVDYAKQLRDRGFPVDIISRRRGFPPPIKFKEPPQLGMLWCPYCIKWREFHVAAVKTTEYTGPSLLRCPACTISIMDYYVRRHNSLFAERYFTSQDIRKKRVEQTRRTRGRR
jgi:hypothetical protein